MHVYLSAMHQTQWSVPPCLAPCCQSSISKTALQGANSVSLPDQKVPLSYSRSGDLRLAPTVAKAASAERPCRSSDVSMLDHTTLLPCTEVNDLPDVSTVNHL